MSSSALDADALEDLLEEILWAEASSKRTAAEALASLTRPQQEFVLRWVQTLEKDNIACAYQFLTHAHRAMRELENDEVEAWIIQGLDVYDRSGLYAAVDVFRNVDKFLARAREAKVGAVLDDYSPVLERVVLGFSGRRLRLQGGERTYTDTETLFLPEVTARFETREDNFRFLKATATYIWAQTRFGTWKQGVIEALTRFDNETRALRLFHMLESLRLDARIAGELPGIHRDMAQLNRLAGQALCPPDWEAWRERLGRRDNRVEDSLALVAELLPSSLPVPNPLCYQGEMLPEQVEQILRERLEDEKAGLRSLLVRYKRELEAEQPATERKAPDARETPFSARTRESAEHPGEMEIELLFHDQPVSPPEDVGRVISSIMLDLGELPPDYLVPAGDGSYKPKGRRGRGRGRRRGRLVRRLSRARRPALQGVGLPPPELSQELVRDAGALGTASIRRLRAENHGPILSAPRAAAQNLRGAAWRGQMAQEGALRGRGGHRRAGGGSRRRPAGPGDVRAPLHPAGPGRAQHRGDVHCGHEWVHPGLDQQGRARVPSAPVRGTGNPGRSLRHLRLLGHDPQALQDLSHQGFEDAYGDDIKARIAGIEAKDNTRMGAAIRNLTEILNGVEAKTRILITLSDGKPDDYSDEYRSEYGIEDTRRALIEAKRSGIHPFCITIDKQGQEYLPHMYGAVNYTIVDEVEQVPYEVSEIYRRLTA